MSATGSWTSAYAPSQLCFASCFMERSRFDGTTGIRAAYDPEELAVLTHFCAMLSNLISPHLRALFPNTRAPDGRKSRRCGHHNCGRGRCGHHSCSRRPHCDGGRRVGALLRKASGLAAARGGPTRGAPAPPINGEHRRWRRWQRRRDARAHAVGSSPTRARTAGYAAARSGARGVRRRRGRRGARGPPCAPRPRRVTRPSPPPTRRPRPRVATGQA